MNIALLLRFSWISFLLLLMVAAGSSRSLPFPADSVHESADVFYTFSGGRAKAAYRNYYLGNFYFAEGNADRARQHFRQAHRAFPDQTSFGLAYALCLGETGREAEGVDILRMIKPGLVKGNENYLANLTLLEYVTAIVRARAGEYARARRAVQKAIQLQEALDDTAHRRLAGMYALGGYLSVMNQESPVRHAGLEPHVHVDRNSLESAFPLLVRGLEADTGRIDARNNLKWLADTLGLVPEISPRAPNHRETFVGDHTSAYPHLPYQMEGIVPFGNYDEVLFLVDISGSMVMEKVACSGVDRFTIMREAAQYLVDQLPETTQAGLATIGGDCGTEPKWWVPTDSLSHKDLKWQIRYLNPDGTTPLLTTLVESLELFRGGEETTKGIFFISDGENVCGEGGLDICDWARQLPARGVTLNVLTFLDHGLGNSGAFAEYACLTDRSGGEVRYLDPISCSIDDFTFELVDLIHFELPPLERVQCRRGQESALWAIFPE